MDEKVSVILPTYKRETHYLDRAIQSLLNQTYKNIEIIVIDDNESESVFRDKTSKFIRKYSLHSNVVYIKNDYNIGGALSRNKGIQKAQGQYITFLDDDDEYLDKKIEKQLEFMKANTLDMSFTNLVLVNEKGQIIDYREHGYINDFSNKQLLKTHIMRKLTGTPTFMYKKEKLVSIGAFDDVPIGQEFHLMLKTIENNLSIGHLDRADVVAYRHNEGGISFGRTKIKGEKDQYDFIKENYFHLFNNKEKRFIRFRYLVVFAMAYKRNKQYTKATINLLLAFLSSPVVFVEEGVKFFSKVKKTRTRIYLRNEMK